MAGQTIIKSPNPGESFIDAPSQDPRYPHPVEGRRATPIPLAFQVTSPFDSRVALLPHMLIMHVNPSSLSETHTKAVERIQTRGGFVEQHWGDHVSEISAEGSTGAFVNLKSGVSSVVRQKTIAWDRYRDLYDLFHHNGAVYDPSGNIVLQGNIMLLYDRGVYLGLFQDFSMEETAESPFTFRLNWSFKVYETVLQVPSVFSNSGVEGTVNMSRDRAVSNVPYPNPQPSTTTLV